MREKTPFELARETLKQLSVRKLAPTPTHYRDVYSEISGIAWADQFPYRELRDLVLSLPAKSPGQEKQKSLLEAAVERMHWEGIKSALMAYGSFAPVHEKSDPGSVDSEAVLLTQLHRILSQLQQAFANSDNSEQREPPDFDRLLKAVATGKRDSVFDLEALVQQLIFSASEQAEVKDALLKLLHISFDNIRQISPEEEWLSAQMEMVASAAQPPLSLRSLYTLEQMLTGILQKQKAARQQAIQSQAEARHMLAIFIERLSEMSESTSSFHTQLEQASRDIENAASLQDLAPVLKKVLEATRSMSDSSKSAADELQQLRDKVNSSQAELLALYQELDRVSQLARHDALTGALNRKGLEEALEKEISAMRRRESPLSVALLDIDNFKKINDRLGHKAGDDALSHLVRVASECLRPQDSLARFGGEEFVVILPDTPLEKAIEAMTRLQRELTKRFFLVESEKMLITFSAGVAQLAANETGTEAVRRADQAMYLAKRAGKNRVFGS
jgi:diguanylate cyclase